MIAALRRAVPSFVRLRSNPMEEGLSTARTVPSEVDDRADPAAKAWTKLNEHIGTRTKDMAMGQSRPVRAMHVYSGRRAVRVEMEELIPPKF
jgi:hypothetical protein